MKDELTNVLEVATSAAQEAPETQEKLLNQYAALVQRVSALPHLMRPANGDPFKALTNLVNLLDTPNNVDALWVWSAFAAAFGQGDTWKAERALNTLLNWIATRDKTIAIGTKPIREVTAEDLEFLKRFDKNPGHPSVSDACEVVQYHCFIMLEHILENFRKWPDLAQFVAFKSSMAQPESTEVKS